MMDFYEGDDVENDWEYDLESSLIQGCCRIAIVSGFPYDNEFLVEATKDDCWSALKFLLEEATKKPVYVTLSEKSQKTMIDFLEATPYWTQIDQVKGEGNYKVNVYKVEVL